MRRQPFILLSFSSSKKLRKAQKTQSYQRIQCIGHTDFKDLSSAVANTPSLLPSMGITRQKMVLAQSSTKWPTFAFTPESGYTLACVQRIAHKGSQGETGAVSDGGAITTLGAFHTFRKPCVARCQNGKLCRFWVLAGCAPEERRKPAGQRCAYVRRCSEAPRPRWAALLCLQFGDVAVFSLCAQGFPHMQKRVWYHYPRRAPRAAETLGGRLSKRLICRFLRSGGHH